jgi:hypothetical protein
MARSRGDVQLASYNRFDPGFLSLIKELDRSMHVAVISHRYRRLPELRCASNNFFKLIGPIEEAVLCVKMEVSELRHVASKKRKSSWLIDPQSYPLWSEPSSIRKVNPEGPSPDGPGIFLSAPGPSGHEPSGRTSTRFASRIRRELSRANERLLDRNTMP